MVTIVWFLPATKMKAFKSPSSKRSKTPQSTVRTSNSTSSTSNLDDMSATTVAPSVELPPENPSEYLRRIMSSRGYDTTPINGLSSRYRITPTEIQMRWYDHPILDAVANLNIIALSQFQNMGATMEACNQNCESILHLAARKGSLDMVRFMLRQGARCFVDDEGRLPMHDVCWRVRPAFDIVSLLLNHDLTMLLVQDRRGSFPLDYVNSRQWRDWCRYLDSIKDQYWPSQLSNNGNNSNTSTEEKGESPVDDDFDLSFLHDLACSSHQITNDSEPPESLSDPLP